LPRRYHRPPAAKRRKPKRTSTPLPYEEPDVSGATDSPLITSDDGYDDEWEEGDELDDEPLTAPAVATAVRPAAGRERVQHLQRDFSYVRTELLRMAAVSGFLVVALIITAILR
jgi:hypothetical protein